MNIDETRGWKSGGRAGGSFKIINGSIYQIFEGICGAALWVTQSDWTKLISSYPTKNDAKRAAYRHAQTEAAL